MAKFGKYGKKKTYTTLNVHGVANRAVVVSIFKLHTFCICKKRSPAHT